MFVVAELTQLRFLLLPEHVRIKAPMSVNNLLQHQVMRAERPHTHVHTHACARGVLPQLISLTGLWVVMATAAAPRSQRGCWCCPASSAFLIFWIHSLTRTFSL